VAGDPGRSARADRCTTGSGKTLAAFLAAIDALVRQGLEGSLREETQIVYVSPLKALSNDIQRNLEAPLAGVREALRAQGLPDVEIRTWVRTGDTPPGERQRMGRSPPHIIVTTPESLYILLGSDSGRKMLATTRTVIVDEIHALAPNKRGAHLSLSLERSQPSAIIPCCASAYRPLKSRSRRSPAFWSEPAMKAPLRPSGGEGGTRATGGRGGGRSTQDHGPPHPDPLPPAGGERGRSWGHDHRHRASPSPRPRPRSPLLAARSSDVGRGLAAGL